MQALVEGSMEANSISTVVVSTIDNGSNKDKISGGKTLPAGKGMFWTLAKLKLLLPTPLLFWGVCILSIKNVVFFQNNAVCDKHMCPLQKKALVV